MSTKTYAYGKQATATYDDEEDEASGYSYMTSSYYDRYEYEEEEEEESDEEDEEEEEEADPADIQQSLKECSIAQ